MQRHDLRVYYDQQACWCTAWASARCRPLVTQEGRMLRIDELKVGA